MLVVDELQRSIITVKLSGSSKKDWERDATTRRSSVPFATSSSSVVQIRTVPAALPTRGRPGRREAKPFWTRRPADPFEGVNPVLRDLVQEELDKRGLDASHIRVITPNRVEII